MQEQNEAQREAGLQNEDCVVSAHVYRAEASALTHLGEMQGRNETQPARWDRVDHVPSVPRISRDSVTQYLQYRPDQSVLILHARVAQKSYGNEKRQEHLKASGLGESSCHVWGYMGLDGSPGTQTDNFKLSFEEQTERRMFACAKTLYISDTDKRKHFRLLLRLFQSGGQEIGSFQSGLIKVISKPSQKRQSMKNADLCIPSGSRVSLFNRLRSQTVSTRYLAVEGGAFVASARQWTAFTVILVEDQQTDRSDYSVCESYICYGAVVQLVCTITGVTLPPMVIRKVNKQHACLDIDEPVSQLHKCAFQLRNSKHMYLCLSNEKILQYQASPCPKESSRELLNDGSCWTITGTEVVEYTFSESLTIRPTLISPIPVINGLELNGGGHVAMLELHGENFSPYLKVWFGNMEAETMFRSQRSLLCVVPDISVFGGEWRWYRQPITVPLSLIRLDGMIYRSSFTFTYTPEHGSAFQPCATTERTANSDTLIDTIHQEFTRTNFHLFMQS
ncbi:recombining binding protein suppressor of hairless-like protein isoform X3 [Hemibagrus wyckioides]|uniref:recombining binding protein suppressor of hairless-like protein isoform X3 n=1 Tax=Hemibagrus wyckioides TaxID=337641 RepID=UPI00266BF8CB|nr:recombining binding protein suppressor of hairless-like protein isoform X3 [Hemibagrus wyckioides]